jgi:hypothetical protein
MLVVRCAQCTTITSCGAGSAEYSHLHAFDGCSCRGFNVHAEEAIQVLDYREQMTGSAAGHVMYARTPSALVLARPSEP